MQAHEVRSLCVTALLQRDLVDQITHVTPRLLAIVLLDIQLSILPARVEGAAAARNDLSCNDWLGIIYASVRVTRPAKPSRNCIAIRVPRLAKSSSQARLFCKHDMKVEDDSDYCGIHQQPTRGCQPDPAAEHQQHGQVHWVSRVPVEPDGDQVPGWIPSCDSSTSGSVELSNACE